ncbi:MAG: hypothetical protein ACRCW2_02800 [Cellulosilyticaceae bacterium]
MLRSRVIGIMESIGYEQDHGRYRQSYELVGELRSKLAEAHELFNQVREDFLQNRGRVMQLQITENGEKMTRFHWIMQGIEQFELSLIEQGHLTMPSNQGSIILFQKIITSCHMDILEELSEYYTVDDMLEKIEIGLKYLGRDEEVFMGLDLFYMLRETTKVLRSMSEQLEAYNLSYQAMQRKLDVSLDELTQTVDALPHKRRKKPNFYEMTFEAREEVRLVYEQLQVFERMKKLPLYKGSLGCSHLYMDNLMVHLEMVR